MGRQAEDVKEVETLSAQDVPGQQALAAKGSQLELGVVWGAFLEEQFRILHLKEEQGLTK